jgi:hypothetical protein
MSFGQLRNMSTKSLLCTAFISAIVVGCSGDITATSDIGEKIIIKPSSVTSSPYDKQTQINDLEEKNKSWLENYQYCVSNSGLDQATCASMSGEKPVSDESIASIRALPEMKTLRYRTIFIDVNGDKKAGSYESVTCLPNGTTDERMKWDELIDGVSDIHDDNSAGSRAIKELCKRFGK